MCSNKNFYSKCLINSFDEKCIKGVHIKGHKDNLFHCPIPPYELCSHRF